MLNFLNKHNISKRKIIQWITIVEMYRGRGNHWINLLQGYLSTNSIRDAFLIGGVAKLAVFPDLSVWGTVAGIVIVGFFLEFIKIWAGIIDYKYKIPQIESEVGTKDERFSPFNAEVEKTLREVCKHLEIKHHFTDLYDK